jgi:hypothetical protein
MQNAAGKCCAIRSYSMPAVYLLFDPLTSQRRQNLTRYGRARSALNLIFAAP